MPIDSLIAAITLEVAALRGTECGESVRPHPAIQSALVRLSGTRIQQGLPGLFEVHRDSLETAFRAESRDRAQAVRAFRRALADVAEHSGGLTLSLSLSAQDPRARTREWMRAVWEDLAHHFHATLLTRPGNAREAGVQMETLHRLVLKAGIPPRNLYAYEDHLPRAREAGGLSPFLYWLRFNLLSYPAWAFLGLFGLLSLAVLGWIAIVSLWRFQLITRSAYLASADGRR